MTNNSLRRTLARIGGLVLASMAAAACTEGAAPAGDAEQNQMRAVTRAVFAADRLWLLQDDGSLNSVLPDGDKAQPAGTPGKTLDICKSAGKLTSLVERQGEWSVQAFSGNAWITMAAIPRQSDSFVTLDCGGEGGPTTIVTNQRIIELQGRQTRSIKLRQPMREPSAVVTAVGTPDAVWIGLNMGEWGGGLRRIDRRNGTVVTVARNQSGNLCGGPLNTECDPVNGIISAPSNPTCLIVAIGLVHMMSHGRIVEVCGDKARRLYYKSLDPQPPRNELDDGEPASTVAFFGLTRSGGKWWAVGGDGLYYFDGARGPKFSPLPKFKNNGGFWVNFDIPDLALVLTDVNQRRSMSGSVPIMAAR